MDQHGSDVRFVAKADSFTASLMGMKAY